MLQTEVKNLKAYQRQERMDREWLKAGNFAILQQHAAVYGLGTQHFADCNLMLMEGSIAHRSFTTLSLC